MRDARVPPVDDPAVSVAHEDVAVVQIVVLDGVRYAELVELVDVRAKHRKQSSQTSDLVGGQAVVVLEQAAELLEQALSTPVGGARCDERRSEERRVGKECRCRG